MTYMSFNPTPKQAELLAYLRSSSRTPGIYGLAKALGRPYKRVFDDVARLASAGLLSVRPTFENGRKVSLVQLPVERPAQPSLSYSRIWSSPVTGADDRVLIASVLAEPTFGDVLACCRHYGIAKVKGIFDSMLGTDELGEMTQLSLIRMLSNIEIGFARAA